MFSVLYVSLTQNDYWNTDFKPEHLLLPELNTKKKQSFSNGNITN